MDIIKKQQMVDIFFRRLQNDYHIHCQKDNYHDLKHFTNYLVEQKLIRSSSVQHFAVLEKFKELHETQAKKTEVVSTLAKIFGLTQRTIWNILKRNK